MSNLVVAKGDISAGSSLREATLPPVKQFHNPAPVVVGLVPVRAIDPEDGVEKIGLLTVQRAIPPRIGDFALPGGFLEYEDWRAGLAREIREETGVRLKPEEVLQHIGLESVQDGKRLLIFAHTKEIAAAKLEKFTGNSECSALKVIFKPTELAFPTHTKMAKLFFENNI